MPRIALHWLSNLTWPTANSNLLWGNLSLYESGKDRQMPWSPFGKGHHYTERTLTCQRRTLFQWRMKVGVMMTADLLTWLSVSPPCRDDGLPRGTPPCSGQREHAEQITRKIDGVTREGEGKGGTGAPPYTKFQYTNGFYMYIIMGKGVWAEVSTSSCMACIQQNTV